MKIQQRKSNVTIATAPCSWGVWYADGGPAGTPWDVFLDEASQAGYVSLELGPDGYLPADAAVLSEELSRRNLAVCAGTACYRFDRYARFSDFMPQVKTLCKRLNLFNAPYLVTMDESDVGEYGEKKQTFTTSQWDKYFGMFKEMGHFTKEEFGIETVFHPHIRSLIETEAEIIRMMDSSGLNLCFDTGHHAYVNSPSTTSDHSAGDFIKTHADKIAYLHFKNVDETVLARVRNKRLTSRQAFDMDVMCDLDAGIIDFRELKQILDDIGYHGIGVIEMDMPKAKPGQAFAAGKRNLEYLRSIGIIG